MPQFKHGIYTATGSGGARPTTIAPTAVTVIVGTAPDADAAVFPANTPVMVPGSATMVAKLDTAGNRQGTLLRAIEMEFEQARAIVMVIRVDEGDDDAATLANVIGTVQADGTRTGMEAILDIQALHGLKPRILIAPGFTSQQTAATKLQTIVDRLRAFAYFDCAGTTPSEAQTYADNFASQRMEACWPGVINVHSEIVPSSAVAAGLRVLYDNTGGEEYSSSISNKRIHGIVGTEYPIDFIDGDSTNTAYILNSNKISTVINDEGFRWWGNLCRSDDPKWQFSSHVRINDILLDAIAAALKWARDRKLNKTFADDVVEQVNLFIQKETRAGNLLGGEAWADPELNTPDTIIAGEFYMDYKFTPPGIAQAITVTSHFVNDYADAVFS